MTSRDCLSASLLSSWSISRERSSAARSSALIVHPISVGRPNEFFPSRFHSYYPLPTDCSHYYTATNAARATRATTNTHAHTRTHTTPVQYYRLHRMGGQSNLSVARLSIARARNQIYWCAQLTLEIFTWYPATPGRPEVQRAPLYI